MKMTQDYKEKVYKAVDEKTGILSHPTSVYETCNLSVNGFPKNSYAQWRQDCKHFFNDIFWAKMWSDHVKAQAYDILISSSAPQEKPAEPKPEIAEKAQGIPMIGDPYGGN